MTNLQCCQTLASFRIPELDRLLAVFAARDHQAFSRMPVDTLDVCSVTWNATNTKASAHPAFTFRVPSLHYSGTLAA